MEWSRVKLQNLKRRLTTSPEIAFLFLAVPFGILFTFVTPVFMASDEHHHFFRAYQLAEFNLKAEVVHTSTGDAGGGYVPANLVALAGDLMGNIPSHYDSKANLHKLKRHLGDQMSGPLLPVPFPGAALYSPAPYIPQITAIIIAKVMHLPILAYIYLGRLFNLLVWILLIYYAIKLTPNGKWVLFVLALLPMTIYQAASLTADAMTNGLVFLCVALFLRYVSARTRLTRKSFALITVATLMLSLSKPGYLPVIFLFCLLPKNVFASVKTHWAFIGTLLLANILAAAAWSKYVQDLLPLVASWNRPGVNINVHAQLIQILHAPWIFAWAIIQTFGLNIFGFADGLVIGLIGNLGWIDTPLPIWAIVLGYLLIVFAASITLHERASYSFNRWQRSGIVVTALMVVGSIAASLYLTFTAVGAKIIYGLQGRYFLPVLAVLVPLCISPKDARRLANNAPLTLITGSTLLLVVAVITVLLRFYLRLSA